MLAGRQVMIVEVHDLVAMKLRAQRPQDDDDVGEIIRHQRLDEAVIRARVDGAAYEHYRQLVQRVSRLP